VLPQRFNDFKAVIVNKAMLKQHKITDYCRSLQCAIDAIERGYTLDGE
jgi:hypothetical protein